jgi:hypothetical protein
VKHTLASLPEVYDDDGVVGLLGRQVKERWAAPGGPRLGPKCQLG